MAEAEVLLRDDVRKFTYGVTELVKVPLANNQLCALISFAFNVGLGSFKNSTLLKLLNAGNYKAVPDQLRKWNKSKGKVLPGLVKRREAEILVWKY